MEDTAPVVAAVAPTAVASPVAPAAAIVPAPVVAAARVPPIRGTVAIAAVDAVATLVIYSVHGCHWKYALSMRRIS